MISGIREMDKETMKMKIRGTVILLLVMIAGGIYASPPSERPWEQLVQVLREGGSIDQQEIDECHRIFMEYTRELSRKHPRHQTLQYPEPDRTDYYIAGTYMAIVDPPRHGGCPTQSFLRLHVGTELHRRVANEPDVFLKFCSVIPGLTGVGTHANRMAGLSQSTAALMDVLDHDEFLANYLIEWLVFPNNGAEKAIEYLMGKARNEEAINLANRFAATGKYAGLTIKAKLMEKLGKMDEAEVCYIEIEQKHSHVGDLVWFYQRIMRDHPDETIYANKFRELKNKYFPEGAGKAVIESLETPPQSGVSIQGPDHTRSHFMMQLGIEPGQVIVAIDGYRVHNLDQYYFIRDMQISKPEIELILWDGQGYVAKACSVPNLRRVQLTTFDANGRD